MSRSDSSRDTGLVAGDQRSGAVVRFRPAVCVVFAALVAVLAPIGVTGAEASSPLQFGKIQYDSPGTDSRSNSSLNAEYVTIKNVGSTNRSLTGFTVRDAQ